MTKTYTLNDIRKTICWLGNAAEAVSLLESHGIMPVSSFSTGRRVFRLYDQSSMDAAVLLRQAHDDDVRERRKHHAAKIREDFKKKVIESKPANGSVPANAELSALSTLVQATTALMQQVSLMAAKLDALAEQHSSLNFDDEPTDKVETLA